MKSTLDKTVVWPPATTLHPLHGKKYDILMLDPPWSHFGDPNKNAAAGKHYSLMSDAELKALPIKSLLKKNAYVFCWATCPRLDSAIETLKAWGLHYRGVAHIWVKTRKSDNGIINGQGIPPTYSKPTTELLLCATTKKVGRPVKLMNSALPQVVLAPRGEHSVKPEVVRQLIEKGLDPNRTLEKLEMFARQQYSGWDAIGNAVCFGEDIRDTIAKMI